MWCENSVVGYGTVTLVVELQCLWWNLHALSGVGVVLREDEAIDVNVDTGAIASLDALEPCIVALDLGYWRRNCCIGARWNSDLCITRPL